MVRFLKTLLADNARRVLFAILAFPGHVASFEYLGADAHACGALLDLADNSLPLEAAVDQDLYELKVHFNFGVVRFAFGLLAHEFIEHRLYSRLQTLIVTRLKCMLLECRAQHSIN